MLDEPGGFNPWVHGHVDDDEAARERSAAIDRQLLDERRAELQRATVLLIGVASAPLGVALRGLLGCGDTGEEIDAAHASLAAGAVSQAALQLGECHLTVNAMLAKKSWKRNSKRLAMLDGVQHLFYVMPQVVPQGGKEDEGDGDWKEEASKAWTAAETLLARLLSSHLFSDCSFLVCIDSGACGDAGKAETAAIAAAEEGMRELYGERITVASFDITTGASDGWQPLVSSITDSMAERIVAELAPTAVQSVSTPPERYTAADGVEEAGKRDDSGIRARRSATRPTSTALPSPSSAGASAAGASPGSSVVWLALVAFVSICVVYGFIINGNTKG
eukprot:PLAT15062.1.p1 GENE.PLAT15062.1~~PLAT15062.1.p1  ORF type:complete len:343 (+),score=89.31 PLAT15062.1:30-1031(+)